VKLTTKRASLNIAPATLAYLAKRQITPSIGNRP
jgi:hypothetical protein